MKEMKLLVISLLLIISLVSEAQYIKGVGIGINSYDGQLGTELQILLDASPTFDTYVGIKYNNFGGVSAISGFYLHEPWKISPFISGQIEFFGYMDIYHHFMPTVKAGIFYKNFSIFVHNYWEGKAVKVTHLITGQLVDGMLPINNFGIGINYIIKLYE